MDARAVINLIRREVPDLIPSPPPATKIVTILGGGRNGEEVYFLADATNGIVWHLRYNAGSASAFKWEFVGGPPLYAEITTSETTTSTTYAALTTAGPAIALPRTGDYMVSIGFGGYPSVATFNAMSYDIGGTGAVDADAMEQNSANARASASRTQRKTGLTAVTLTAKYKVGSGTGTFEKRWMRVEPVRLG